MASLEPYEWLPTPELRYITRCGEKILQQKWDRYLYNPDTGYNRHEHLRIFEWRPIPIEMKG